MCVSFATERQDVALNSSGERQTEKETDKEKTKINTEDGDKREANGKIEEKNVYGSVINKDV